MLRFIARMFRVQSTAKIELLARQVVEASIDEVTRLVAERIATMPMAEARGYVRARCARVVRRQTKTALLRQSGALAHLGTAIIPVATEQLLPRVLRQTATSASRRVSSSRAA